jgi:hypothetical protein
MFGFDTVARRRGAQAPDDWRRDSPFALLHKPRHHPERLTDRPHRLTVRVFVLHPNHREQFPLRGPPERGEDPRNQPLERSERIREHSEEWMMRVVEVDGRDGVR